MILTQVANRQEVNDLYSLIAALADESPDGTSPIKLSIKTQLPHWKVESLLAKHNRYFVNVFGKNVFALNRFGGFRGSVPEIHQDIERAYVESRKRARWVVWSGLSTATIAILLAGLFYASGWFAGSPWFVAPLAMFLSGIAVASTGLRSA